MKLADTYTITEHDVGYTHRNMLGALRAPFPCVIRPKDVGKQFTLIRGKLTCLSESPK